MKQDLEKKSWDEFRNTGLFLFINNILHAFGWCIVVEIDDITGDIKNTYPCRTKFRGFDNKEVDESHEKIAKYLSENAPNFPEEIK